MNKKTFVIILSSLVVLIMFSGVIFLGIASAGGHALNRPAMAQENNTDIVADGDTEEDNDDTYIPSNQVDGNASEEDYSNEISASPEGSFVPASELDLDPSSITVFVNKEYALPKDYKPEQLVTPDVIFNLVSYDERTLMRPEAARALEGLFNDAKQQGIVLYGVSAYRSYERQHTIFRNNIVKKGKRYTLRYSAVPGTSEHQLGLAIDVSAKSQNFKLSENFASSPEGKWLADNAYKYGYIIRYPKGDEDITGYAFEPWHIRYVGNALAKYLYDNKLTLEEYYQYTPSPDFNFEAKYAAIINYTPPVVTVAPEVSGVPEEGDGTIIDEDGKVIDIGEEDTLPKVSPTAPPSDTEPKVTKAPEENDITVTPTPSVSYDLPYTDEQGQSEEDAETPEYQNPDASEPGNGNQDGDNDFLSPTPQITPIPTSASNP